MKNIILFAGALSLMSCFSSCGGSDTANQSNDGLGSYYDSINRADSIKNAQPPKAVRFTDCTDSTLDGSKVILEGYVTVGSSVYESSRTISLELFERKNQFSGDYISISVPVGTDNNNVKSLPDKYKKTDLQLKGKSGEEIRNGDHIRVMGQFQRSYSPGDYGYISVMEIEKIDDVAFDYAASGAKKVTTDTTGFAALSDSMVYAEGFLEIPSMVYITESVYFDLKPSRSSSDYLTVDILIGKGPNLVEDLPDNYSEADIKIHDHKDQIVGKKKVRVYGIMNYGRIHAEHIEIL